MHGILICVTNRKIFGKINLNTKVVKIFPEIFFVTFIGFKGIKIKLNQKDVDEKINLLKRKKYFK